MPGTMKWTFTVMADDGVGEFLWCKDARKVFPRIGGYLYSLMDRGANPEIFSYDLFADFCAWAEWYMRERPDDYCQSMRIDWDAFNTEGVRLARRLRAQVSGNGYTVQYARAHRDPDSETQLFIDLDDPR